MNTMITRVRQFLTSEDGPTAVEYAVLIGLIAVALADRPHSDERHQQHVHRGEQHAWRVVIGLAATPLLAAGPENYAV